MIRDPIPIRPIPNEHRADVGKWGWAVAGDERFKSNPTFPNPGMLIVEMSRHEYDWRGIVFALQFMAENKGAPLGRVMLKAVTWTAPTSLSR